MDRRRSRGLRRIHPGRLDEGVHGEGACDAAQCEVPYSNTWAGINRRIREILKLERPDLLGVCDKYALQSNTVSKQGQAQY